MRDRILHILCTLTVLGAGCGARVEPEPVAERAALSSGGAGSAWDGAPGEVPSVSARFVPMDELAGDLKAPGAHSSVAVPVVEEVVAVAALLKAQELEPNDDAEAATKVTLPFVLTGHMNGGDGRGEDGDVDWYSFDVEREVPGLLRLELSALAGANLGLEVFREGLRGREILITVNNYGAGKGEEVGNVCLVNGRYWVRVYQKPAVKRKKKIPFSSDEAVYELRGLAEEKMDLAGGVIRECEPNADPLVARLVELPLKLKGTLNSVEDKDLVVLDLTRLSPFSYFSIDLLAPAGSKAVLSIENRAGQSLFSLDTGSGSRVVLPNLGLLSGYSEYFVAVRGAGGNKVVGEYELSVEVTRLEERMELEPNASPELALRMPYDQPVRGWILSESDADLYLVEAPSDMPTEGEPLGRPVIHFSVGGVAGVDLVVEVLGDGGQVVEQLFDNGGKGQGETIPNMPIPKAGKLVRLSSKSGDNALKAYEIVMTLVSAEGFEYEPNDSPESGNRIEAAGEVRGYISHTGDRDCFVIAPEQRPLVLRAPDDSSMRIERVLAGGEVQVAALAGGKSATLPGEAMPYTLCLMLGSEEKRAATKPYWLGIIAE